MKQRMISSLLPLSVIIAMASVACAEIAKPKSFDIRSYRAVGDDVAMEIVWGVHIDKKKYR